jgi:ribosomal protein S18 acetylase RimI-like enzyme
MALSATWKWVPDVAGREEALLQFAMEASRPYDSFVYAAPDEAAAVNRSLFEARACEFTPEFARLATDEAGLPVGAAVWMTGAELNRARMKTALALASRLPRDGSTFARLRAASQTLLRPAADDFHLTRIAVDAAYRGRGVGRFLADRLEREARAAGAPRIVLEVSEDSPGAVQFYERLGFERSDRRECVDAETGRRLRYLHLARSLR